MAVKETTAAVKRQHFEKLTRGFRSIFIFVFGLSRIINLLALTGAFYMLQIYDRALTSGSISTLMAISIIAIGLYLFQGMFDVIRSQILIRVGARMDRKLSHLTHEIAIDMPCFGYSTADAFVTGMPRAV